MSRILLIDYDVHFANMSRNLLLHDRHEVQWVKHFRPAIQTAVDFAPDLILLDVMLPGGDGFRLCKELKSDERINHIPVLIASARGNARDITQGFQCGAHDYLVKPVHFDVLMARVNTQLRLKEAQDRLQAANAELLRVSEIKSRLVSVVSHELRTPLTSIRGALDLMQRFESNFSQRSQRLTGICYRNTERLIRLVNGVLNFARLEAGLELHLEAVALGDVLSRAVEEIEALLETKQVPVVVDLAEDVPPIQADFDRIHQVLINLVSNAAKFSEPGQTIVLGAEMLSPELVKVSVHDEACGISADDIGKLFQPFSQLEHSGDTGSGLGLAISREIVERHGGQIGVDSIVGEGSTFWFQLPVSGPAGALSSSAHSVGGSSDG